MIADWQIQSRKHQGKCEEKSEERAYMHAREMKEESGYKEVIQWKVV